MKSWWLVWVGIVGFNTLAQLLIKLGADAAHGISATGLAWLLQAASSPWMLAACAVEIVSFFIWIKVLSEFELSRLYPLTAISYVLIIAVSWLWFREPLKMLQLVGSALILGGVWMIGTGEETSAAEAEPNNKRVPASAQKSESLFGKYDA